VRELNAHASRGTIFAALRKCVSIFSDSFCSCKTFLPRVYARSFRKTTRYVLVQYRMREHGSSNASINRDLSMGKESLAGEAVAEKEKQETKKYKRVHGKKIQLPHGSKRQASRQSSCGCLRSTRSTDELLTRQTVSLGPAPARVLEYSANSGSN
jgi:hypothetical protein